MRFFFNYKVFSKLFLVLLALLLVLDYFLWVPIVAYVLLAVAFVSIVAYGSAKIESQFFVSVICSQDTVEKKVALTLMMGLMQSSPLKYLNCSMIIIYQLAFFV